MKKILAIDDQQDNLVTIKAVLKSYLGDCNVITALSGELGLEIARREQPDTIVLDIIMPKMDGYECCRLLKSDELTSHIPILMLTAIKTDTDSRVRGLELGADAFLSKPIDPIELSAQVKVLLRIKEVEDKLKRDKLSLKDTVIKKTFQLKESEQKYKALFENAPLPYQSLSEEGKYLDVNPAWVKLLGYSREDVIDSYYKDYLHPKWKAHFEENFPKFKKQGYIHDIEFKIKHKNGNYLDIKLEGCIGYNPDGSFKQTYCVFSDITETKVIKQELLESEEYFRTLIENSSDYINILSEDGNIISNIYENQEILGYQESEFIGINVFSLVHPSDLPLLSLRFQDLLKRENEHIQVKFRFLHKDGSWRYMEGTGRNMLHHPRIKGLIVKYRDITDQKIIENEKYESDRKLKTLINNLPGIAYRCKNDENWTMEFLSAGFEDITEYSTIDVIGNAKLSFNDLILAEDRELINEKINIALGNRESFEVNYRIRTASDKIKFVLEKGVGVYSEENVVIALEGFITDITEIKGAEVALKLNEEYLKSVFKGATDVAFVTTDIGGEKTKVLGFSPGAEELFGYAAEEIIGKDVAVLHPKEIVETFPDLQKKLIDGQSIEARETKLIHKSGKSISSLFSIHPLFDNYGKTIGGLGVAIDISSRKKVENALKESEQVNRSITDSVADAIISIDSKGIVKSWNLAAARIFGLSSEEMINNSVDKIVPKGFLSAHKKGLARLDEGGHEKLMGQTVELLALNKSGKEFPIELSLSNWEAGNKKFYTGIIRDITEIKSSRESVIKLSKAVEQSPSVIAITDLDGRLEYVNPKFTELTGYSSEEIIGKSSNLLKSGELEPSKYDELWEAIKSGKEWRGVFHNKKKDGSLFWESASISPIYSDDGIITSYIKVAEDITESKKAIEDLKVSEDKYRKLIETTSEGFWLIDEERKTLDVNKSLCEMLGYSKEEMLNKTPFEFVDKENTEVFKEYIGKAKKEKHRVYKIFLNHKNNTKIPVLFNATSVVNNTGKFSGSFAFVTNITERDRAEKMQKIIYNISNAVITTSDLKSLISLIQSYLSEIIDTTNFYVALYDAKTDTLSLPFFVDEKDNLSSLPAGKTLTNYVIKTKKSLLANSKKIEELQSFGHIRSYGADSKVWLGVPLKIEDRVTGVLAVQSYTDENAFNDSDMKMLEFVSDQVSLSIHRKKSEENLKHALDKATESDKLKTAFLQNISHEIRTPMNGILGFTSLLKDPNLTGEEQQSYIDVIMISGKRMLDTLNDLMDISKLETGQMKINMSEMAVNEELKNLFDFFKPEVENRQMKIVFNASLKDEDTLIKTDKEKLLAVLSNLIKNALKYSRKGIIEFGYSLKDEMLEFYVKDMGIGIPLNRQKAIFDRFVQADIEDIKVFEGAGLGLSISQAYVEMLDGKIWVNSVEGQGSKFYFTIPYSQVVKESIVVEKKNMDISVSTHKTSKKLKLLIVEDELYADEYLSIVFEDYCSEILHADNGQKAVEECRKNPDIDLVFMDIKMPILDGHEATLQIREFNKDIIIIAQTANALIGDREKALEVGCNEYISKPIQIDELKEKIEALLDVKF